MVLERPTQVYPVRTQSRAKRGQGARWMPSDKLFAVLLVAILACLVVACAPQPGNNTETTMPTPTHEAAVSEDVAKTLEVTGTVQVRISLTAPDETVRIGEQLQQIAVTQNRVLDQVSAEDLNLVYRYQTIPALVGIITSEGLGALRANPAVQAVTLETADEGELLETAVLIRAVDVWREYGFTGKGVNVAVLDTGIDNQHPDLSESIVDQHCFVACANGERSNAQDDNGHGTHMAGIIASRGKVSPRGIAPGAGLVAVRVRDTTGADKMPDVAAGIDWVVANRAQLNVRIITLGMHRSMYTGACDAEVDRRLVEAVGRAQRAGIIVFAPAGNSGLAEMMAAPACISGVLSVGYTGKTDRLSLASNGGSELDLLAPGEWIRSTALGGGQTTLNGTSHAAPHAAAVAALMLQADPSLSAADVERILEETGMPVLDSRTHRTTARVDALAAIERVVNTE